MESNIKKEVIEKQSILGEEGKKAFTQTLPPEERLDVAKKTTEQSKKNPEINEIKQKSLKDRIMGMFKSKTINEMTDPEKMRKMVDADIYDLGLIKTEGTGLGITIDQSSGYGQYLKKYNLIDSESENLAKELMEINIRLSKMEGGGEKINLTETRNAKAMEFKKKMRNAVENRIAELAK